MFWKWYFQIKSFFLLSPFQRITTHCQRLGEYFKSFVAIQQSKALFIFLSKIYLQLERSSGSQHSSCWFLWGVSGQQKCILTGKMFRYINWGQTYFFFTFFVNFYYSESICKKSWLKYLTIKSYNYWNFDLGDDNNFLNWCFCQWNGVSFSHFLQSRKYWHNLRSSFDWKVQWVLEKQLRN